MSDYVFSNGVIGKLVTYNMEERERVKIVNYLGSKKLEQTKIDEKLKEVGITIRLDSFLDPGSIRRVEGVIRDMLAEKGHQFATITHKIEKVSGGPKLVHLTFHINDGPKVKIRDIEFVGNKAVSDGTLQRKMKENKERWFFSFITGRGTYRADKFEEDAEKVVGYYRDKGYIEARIGQPELKYLEQDAQGKTRWVQLRIPVEEGARYRVASFGFGGNAIVKSEHLRPLFKLKEGQYYSEKAIRKGLEKAREIYGAGGYWEMTGYPDLEPRQAESTVNGRTERSAGAVPKVDVTMRMQEGKQYFINRIEFSGNTTTRGNVIRRELRIYENGVFNTEGLKYSIRRLNQLGYFKPLENEAIKVEKAPGFDNKVNVGLKFEEQNRNQLTFGAGVSQFEGVFGQLAFQTSNFLGRGETFSVQLQRGARATNYQLGFTEPFLFD
ncbi:MAG: BamA/OMP85 family outer membrane protein, partial [Acidimicrobiia bacterium]